MWTTGYVKPAASALVPALLFLFVPPAWSHCGSHGMGCDNRTKFCLFTWVALSNVVSLLFLRIHEKDGKIKSVEELLQAEILKVASKEKTVQVSLCNPCLPFCVDATTTFVCYCMAFYSDQFVASIFVAFLCFHCPTLSCFVIEKALTQEIEALKEEVGNSQLEMEKQVKYSSASSVNQPCLGCAAHSFLF